MNLNNTTYNYSTAEGTTQNDRFLEALNPDSVLIQDFSTQDWMKFAWHFAKQVNYFNPNNELDGNWQNFFTKEEEIEAVLKDAENNANLTPHLTLFVCFLKLLEYNSTHINKITSRHLDFYYSEILKINKKEPVADQAFVLFELAKNQTDHTLESGTTLIGPKDAKGNTLKYKLKEDAFINNAKIADLKSIYIHDADDQKAFKASTNAPIDNNILADNPENGWYPFGFSSSENTDVKPGFIISSPQLQNIKAGCTIDIVLDLENDLPYAYEVIKESLTIELSGKKSWLKSDDIRGRIIHPHAASSGGSKLIIGTYIHTSLDKVQTPTFKVPFEAKHPLLKISFNASTKLGFQIAQHLSTNKLTKIKLKTQKWESANLDISNDFGKLKTDKPFVPFGHQPTKDSKVIIKAPEIFDQKLTQAHLNIKWKNPPSDIKMHYSAYKEGYLNKKTFSSSTPIVNNCNHFTANVNSYTDGNNEKIQENVGLFAAKDNKSVSISLLEKPINFKRNTEIHLSLNQSFLHEVYPKVLALSMMDESITNIPHEPYTPCIENIEISYTSESEVSLTEFPIDNNKSLETYHIHPFGYSKIEPASAIDFTGILPYYSQGGELYIGLENIQAPQQISLLFEMVEGSENPQQVEKQESNALKWSYLGNKRWETLEDSDIITNTTDQFLKTGIVKINIPAEACDNNPILPTGLHWLKISNSGSFDAVCKIKNIYTQAAHLEFKENNNTLEHLSNGLAAGSIKSFEKKVGEIKKISQPIASFGGVPKETQTEYYRRVSERLRHKNKAITQWDYEHLILDQFPEIYKTKCLNHTSKESSFAPGEVLIIVIPNLKNINETNFSLPMVSKAKLNSIENFINQHNSEHIKASVINPVYEEVKIEVKVKFKNNYDANSARKELNNALRSFLSPWAFSSNTELKFGTNIYFSTLITYIDQLEYVDFLSEIKMKHNGSFKSMIEPSSPKAILVSAKEHDIKFL